MKLTFFLATFSRDEERLRIDFNVWVELGVIEMRRSWIKSVCCSSSWSSSRFEAEWKLVSSSWLLVGRTFTGISIRSSFLNEFGGVSAVTVARCEGIEISWEWGWCCCSWEWGRWAARRAEGGIIGGFIDVGLADNNRLSNDTDWLFFKLMMTRRDKAAGDLREMWL